MEQYDKAGLLSLSTHATVGTTWVQPSSKAASEVIVYNFSLVDIEVRYTVDPTVSLKVSAGFAHTFVGIENTNDIEIRRIDVVAAAVTLTLEWRR